MGIDKINIKTIFFYRSFYIKMLDIIIKVVYNERNVKEKKIYLFLINRVIASEQGK